MYCPHCQRPLPDPPERFCPHCGGDIQGATVALGSVPPAADRSTPWESRDQLGLVAAFVETARQVLLEPTAFFSRMPTRGGIGAPLTFGLLTTCLAIVVASLYQLVFSSVMGSWAAGLSGKDSPFERLLPFVGHGFGFAVQLLVAPVVALVSLFVFSALVHLFLMLFGGAHEGFEGSFRVLCYSQATQLLQIVPLCGGIVASVWGLVALIIGLSEAHRTGKGTAAAAVLAPIVLLCCCCAGAILLTVGGIAGLAGMAQR
jgi:hypothetical protein